LVIMMQPALRPVRHSAARCFPAGSALAPPPDNQCTATMMVQPMHASPQVMVPQPMPPNQQGMQGPFYMVVPASQLLDGPSMVAAGTAVPFMPWSEEWGMPQIPQLAIDQPNCGSRPAWGAKAPDILVGTHQDASDIMSDSRRPVASSRKQRRKQRGPQSPDYDDAALEGELQEMRAAVGNMLRIQESTPGLQANLQELRAVVGDMTSCREEGSGASGDLPEFHAGARGRIFSDSCESAENGVVDKAESEKAISRLSSGIPAEQQDVFAWLTSSPDSIWLMASSRHGCRIIQKALDVFGPSEKVILVDGLRGHVQDALESPHANHVLQKIVEMMPPDCIRFVIEEMKGFGAFFARRRFGCRVVERLLEHCPCSDLSVLTEEILQDAEKLCRHPYGNFVMQHLLQHGTDEQRHALAKTLRENIIRLTRHRNASHVVEAAFVHCTPEDKQQLMHAMEDDLSDLSRTRCGSFVVREVLNNLPAAGTE